MMDTQEYKFKTNIHCSGCVETVTPYLDKTEGINDWDVDVDSQDKILTVKTSGVSEEQVMDVVKKAGFQIKPLGKKSFFKNLFS